MEQMLDRLYSIREIAVGDFIIYDHRIFMVMTNYKGYNSCETEDGITTMFNDDAVFERIEENIYRKIENVVEKKKSS